MDQRIDDIRPIGRAHLDIGPGMLIPTGRSGSLDKNHRRQSRVILYIGAPVRDRYYFRGVPLICRELLNEGRSCGILIVVTPAHASLVQMIEDRWLGKAFKRTRRRNDIAKRSRGEQIQAVRHRVGQYRREESVAGGKS